MRSISVLKSNVVVKRLARYNSTTSSPGPRRVVVTGLGLLTALGSGVERVWARVLAGDSGVTRNPVAVEHDLPSTMAARVVEGTGDTEFDPSKVMSPSEIASQARFVRFAVCTAHEALSDAGWFPESEEDRQRTGVSVGSGIGGFEETVAAAKLFEERGHRRISPYFIPRILASSAPGYISIKFGLRGPNVSCSTACATGGHAIGEALSLIRRGAADVMVAGSAESGATSPLAIAGFCRCRALSTWKGEPSLAARPFARGRDGFVMGEGAGALVLEEREHARRRGAHIYAELVGFGLSGDGHHITEPDPEGRGSRAAMMGALSGFDARRVGYINAHATSTPVGDAVENRAIKEVFGSHAYSLAVSSTKAATGHGLGAAGAIEAVLAVKALQSGRAPPTLNCSDREAEFDLNYVAEQAQDLPGLEAVMSNSFGFGGTNSSLLFVAA
eukprot:950096_1